MIVNGSKRSEACRPCEVRQSSFVHHSVSDQKFDMDKKKFSFTVPVLRRNSKRWYFEWHIILPGGVRYRKKCYGGINTGKTADEREQLAAAWLKQFDPHDHLDIGPKKKKVKSSTLHQKLQRYLDDHRDGWKHSTYKHSAGRLQLFSDWCASNCATVPIEKIDSRNAKLFMRWLNDVHHVSTTTHNHYRALLFTVYRRWRVKENPFELVHRFPENKTPQKAFTPEQRLQLTEWMREHDAELFLFVGFMYYTFLRPNEIRNLRVNEVDLTAKIVTVPGLKSKTNKTVTHKIPDVFFDQIKFLNFHHQQDFVFGYDGVSGPTRHGRDRYMRRLRVALDHFNFSSKYSLYSWRHTGAINLYEQYHDIYLVCEALGHTSVDMTKKYLRNFHMLDDPRLAKRDAM